MASTGENSLLTEIKNITKSVNKEKIAKPKQNFRYPWNNRKCVFLSWDVSEGEKKESCAGEQLEKGQLKHHTF